MDFNLALIVSAHVAFFLMLGALAVYSRRIYLVRDRVSSSTFRALVFFGIASFFMGLIILVASYTDSLMVQRTWVLLFMMALINSIVHIATDNKRIHYVIYAYTLIRIVSQLIILFVNQRGVPSIIFITLLALNMILVIIASIWIFSRSPGPFAGGLLTLESTFLIFWYLATSKTLYSDVQSFLFVFVPIVMAASLLASLLRPPRTIITLFVGIYALVLSSGLFVGTIIAGDYDIALYIFVANIPILATIFSIDFFAEQASSTHATVPTYITIALVSISIAIVFTCVDRAFAFRPHVTLEFLSWLEVILGTIAASSFIMSGIATIVQKGHRHIRRLLLANISMLAVLGHPFIRGDRWTFEVIGIFIFIEVSIGIFAYGRTSWRLYRLGAKRAAYNFISFNIASVLLGVIIIISFFVPLLILLTVLIVATVAMMLSSPRRFKRSRPARIT
ncbi:MAG: hypothetical protein K9W43_10410 [Candidatus Thorarchaeota archaeon]|nr:hypothetical protein [Candidatus Thorarchaeota archaeon]